MTSKVHRTCGEVPTEHASVTCQLTGREIIAGRRKKKNNLATKLQLYKENYLHPNTGLHLTCEMIVQGLTTM